MPLSPPRFGEVYTIGHSSVLDTGRHDLVIRVIRNLIGSEPL